MQKYVNFIIYKKQFNVSFCMKFIDGESMLQM